jgi:putative Ca2+/H+ antiporter (TMEM165/GDT1 family)
MDPVAALTTFLVVFPAELPDKTMVATLVLATRYRPLLVWLGVAAAFVVQCLVAVAAGGLLSLLPRRPVLAVTAVIFAVGAVIMWRHARHAVEEEAEAEHEYDQRARASVRGWRVCALSFGVLFAAEWGDLSQLATAGLAARYGEPLSVFVGAWTALAVIAALAATAGRTLLRYVPLAAVRRIAAGLFTVAAILTAAEALEIPLPV